MNFRTVVWPSARRASGRSMKAPCLDRSAIYIMHGARYNMLLPLNGARIDRAGNRRTLMWSTYHGAFGSWAGCQGMLRPNCFKCRSECVSRDRPSRYRSDYTKTPPRSTPPTLGSDNARLHRRHVIPTSPGKPSSSPAKEAPQTDASTPKQEAQGNIPKRSRVWGKRSGLTDPEAPSWNAVSQRKQGAAGDQGKESPLPDPAPEGTTTRHRQDALPKDGGGGGGLDRYHLPEENFGQAGGVAQGKHMGPKVEGTHLLPTEICQKLSEHVIGQWDVKRALAVGVYNHLKRVGTCRPVSPLTEAIDTDEYPDTHLQAPKLNLSDGLPVEQVVLDKTNIMIVGPTGSGKTFLARTLAKLVGVPLVIVDATCLTQAGYVGEDVESILKKLYEESGQDIDLCKRGIVYIDEIDKLSRKSDLPSANRDVSGEGVQQALLKILEGTVVNVRKALNRRSQDREIVQVDTTDILFIGGGAFAGLEKLINSRLSKSSIGFEANLPVNLSNRLTKANRLLQAEPEDLLKYGLIPELVGRFPTIVSTQRLDLHQMVEVMTKPKNSLIKQYKFQFSLDDVAFHITDAALQTVAQLAIEKNTGARGLRSILENVLAEAMYVVPGSKDLNAVYVDEDAVLRKRSVLLLKGDMTLERFLEKEGANKRKTEGTGGGGEEWWSEGVAEAAA